MYSIFGELGQDSVYNLKSTSQVLHLYWTVLKITIFWRVSVNCVVLKLKVRFVSEYLPQNMLKLFLTEIFWNFDSFLISTGHAPIQHNTLYLIPWLCISIPLQTANFSNLNQELIYRDKRLRHMPIFKRRHKRGSFGTLIT